MRGFQSNFIFTRSDRVELVLTTLNNEENRNNLRQNQGRHYISTVNFIGGILRLSCFTIV